MLDAAKVGSEPKVRNAALWMNDSYSQDVL